jgi:hypothetical protein
MMRAAEASSLGRAYMDWSPMPIVDVLQPRDRSAAEDSGDMGAVGLTVVNFRDPRFMGGWMQENNHTALTAKVVLDSAGRVVSQSMDGRTEPQR